MGRQFKPDRAAGAEARHRDLRRDHSGGSGGAGHHGEHGDVPASVNDRNPPTLDAGFGGFVVDQCLEPDAELESASFAAVAAPGARGVGEAVS